MVCSALLAVLTAVFSCLAVGNEDASQAMLQQGATALRMSAALLKDDSCTGPDMSSHGACGLGALQASMQVRQSATAKEKLALGSKAGQEAAYPEPPVLSSGQFTGRTPKHAHGLAILRQLIAASRKVLAVNGEDPKWLDLEDAEIIETARASVIAPISGTSLLLLCLVSLYCFSKFFTVEAMEKGEVFTEIEHRHPGHARADSFSSNSTTAPLHEQIVEDDSTNPGGSTSDADATSVSSGTEDHAALTEEKQPVEEERAPFMALFRFATAWDCLLTFGGILCGMVHGACMPLAFYFLEELFEAVYLPNDDGTLPPVPSPHNLRNAEVGKVVRTYLALAATVLVARTGGCFLIIRAADRQVMAARQAYFRTILVQGPAWHEERTASELAPQLVNDTHLFRDGLGERIVDFSRAVAMALTAMVAACIKDWKLTIVMCFVLPVAALCMSLAIEVTRSFANVMEATYAKAGMLAVTATQMIRTVTCFNGQQKELQGFTTQIDKSKSNAVHIGVVAGFSMGLINTVLIVGMSLGVYFGSLWVLQDYEADCWKAQPPFGTCRTGGTMMSAMFTVIWGFTMGLGSVNMCLLAFANARAAILRINKIIDDPLRIKSGNKMPLDVVGEVTFQEIFFSYPSRGDAWALEGVSAHISPGSTTAFVGSSGSGKSTMVSLLLRFYEPQSGRICLDGVDIRELSLSWLRSKLALVEQEPVLFQMDIKDNIACGSDRIVDQKEVEEAANLAGAHKFVQSFPSGYDTQVGEAGAQLSGGQKQRLAIARALIRKPAVLLLDEATSALDSASEKAVQAALDDLLQLRGRTTIIIAHRLSTIRNADQICVMDSGRMVENGTHDDLIARGGAYETLLQLQLAARKEDLAELSGAKGATAAKEVPMPKADSMEPAPLEDKTMEQLASPMASGQSLLESAKPVSLEAKPSCDEENKDSQDHLEHSHASYLTENDFQMDWGVHYAVKRVWAMSRQDYKYYIYGVIFTFVGALVMPYYSIQFAHTINIFNRPPSVQDPGTGRWYAAYDEQAISSNITSLCMLMQALGILWVLQSVGASYCFSKAGEELTVRVRAALFDTILRQEMVWHDKFGTSQLLWKLGADIPQLKAIVGANIAAGCNAGFTMLVGLGVSIYFAWRFTLCLCILLPLIGIGSVAVGANWRKVDGDFSSGVISESINAVKAVSAFGLENRMMSKYQKLLEKHMSQERSIRIFSAIGTGVASGGVFLIMAVAAFAVNVFTSRGLMQIDTATVVIMTLMTTVSSFGQLTMILSDTTLPRDAARRLFNIIDRKSRIDPYDERGLKLDKAEGRVELCKVHFHYPTRPALQVLKGTSLIIEARTTTALVGSSGCGKSTVIGLLQRFYDPQGGSILFDGHNVRDLNLAWLRSRMSLVQQEPVLFARSVLDNIRYSKENASMEEVLTACRAARVSEFLDRLPQGLATNAGNRGTQLSGGQKQRIAIARALLRDPAVLLLDEATSSLDAVSEKQVQDALDALLEESPRTTIIIAHRLSTIRNADQICVFDDGNVVETGNHEQLITIENGYYSKLVSAQQICK
eukprot:TRINITY_DN23609_c0_g1_i1.p1 TRINITY_DN23609_c0_g1~~TRINITY_DN23609_c0_g1_i1.p1  ORF type:complete len:1552 (-),score=307.23 TRINITY_DN23609_c0_g1_i1:357-5012(-)